MNSDVAEAGEPTGGRTATVVAATIALSLVSLAYNLAFAAIVFRDELAFALPLGLGVALVAQVISGVFVAVRSSIRGHFAGPQDTPAIVLAPAAASLAGLGASTVPTVFALAALSTLAVGPGAVADRSSGTRWTAPLPALSGGGRLPGRPRAGPDP